MRIAALVESPDHVCCRYRIEAFRSSLEGAGHRLSVLAIPKGLFSRLRLFRSLSEFEVVVLQRKLLSILELKVLRACSKLLVFDFDDAVWLRDSYSAKGLADPRRSRRFANVCRLADALTPGNAFLDRATIAAPRWPRSWFDARKRVFPTLIIPTCVDETLYPAVLSPRGDDRIRLVWIGSSSTLQGLEAIAPMLDSLAYISPNLLLRIVCDKPLKLNRLPVEFVAWNAVTEVRSLRESDIGISSIPDDDWSRGKCGLKTLQYMAAGLPVIANPVGVHVEMIVPGETGYLPQTTEDWQTAVRSLVDHEALRLKLGKAARQRFEERYSVRRGAELWLKLLAELVRQQKEMAKPVPVKSMKDGNLVPAPSEIRWHRAFGSPLVEGTLDIASMLADGSATIVKDGPHRTVYRFTIETQAYYWKFCKIGGFRAWAREWLREPKAKLEYDQALLLRKWGIGTFEPIAWGVQPGFFAGQSHLISKAIPVAAPLNETMEQLAPDGHRERRLLTEALGEFLAKMVKAGIFHPDLHPGNILVERHEGVYRLFLLDLHAIRSDEQIEYRLYYAQLRLFNRWFLLRTSRTDRHRFWKSFIRTATDGRHKRTFDTKEIEPATSRSNAELWRSRFKRPVAHARHFPPVHSGQTRGFRAADFPKPLAERLANDPDRPFEELQKLWKNSKSSTVVPVEYGGKSYVWKRFKVQGLGDAVKNLIRRSPTLHSWLMGHALLDRWLPTAKPLLVLHRYKFGIPREGYLLCERLENACELHEALDKPFAESKSYKRELIHQLARTIRQMHERFILHRDLKAANILVQTDGEKPLVWFIDLVGMKPVRPPQIFFRRALERQLRDLVRLNASFADSPSVTRTDRLRFLRTYFLWAMRKHGNWKSHWRWIEQATQAKIERNRKRGRVLK